MKHPGQRIREDFMAPLKLNASQLAKALGLHRSTVTRLLKGHIDISVPMAARLAVCFQTPPKWWIDLQGEYNAYLCQEQDTQDATPLQIDDDLLITPTGFIHLGPPNQVDVSKGLAIPYTGFETEHTQAHIIEPATKRTAKVVRYENGAVALVGDHG